MKFAVLILYMSNSEIYSQLACIIGGIYIFYPGVNPKTLILMYRYSLKILELEKPNQ